MGKEFENIKAGDKVIISREGLENIFTVEKVTPTGRIKVNGEYYRSDDGHKIGSGIWCRGYIVPYTEERAEAIKREGVIRCCIRDLRGLTMEDLSYEKAVRILAILKEKEQTKENEPVEKEEIERD